MKKVQTPITGTLRSFAVKPGDTIAIGQEIATVESMKMLIPVLAEIDGRVARLVKNPDEPVHEGETLLELE
jgi:acetyl-CoA carboxylase biotin carboxyl carrier protein